MSCPPIPHGLVPAWFQREVQDVAVRRSDEEPAHTSWLRSQRMYDLAAAPLRFFIRTFDISRVDGSDRTFGCGGVERYELDYRAGVGRGVTGHSSHVALLTTETLQRGELVQLARGLAHVYAQPMHRHGYRCAAGAGLSDSNTAERCHLDVGLGIRRPVAPVATVCRAHTRHSVISLHRPDPKAVQGRSAVVGGHDRHAQAQPHGQALRLTPQAHLSSEVARRPAPELMWMIEPPPSRFMMGTAARLHRTAPITFDR